LSFHSIFEGLAIALEISWIPFWVITASVAVHKAAEVRKNKNMNE